MAANKASSLASDVQETQFAPSSLIDHIVHDETDNPLPPANSRQDQGRHRTSTRNGDGYRLDISYGTDANHSSSSQPDNTTSSSTALPRVLAPDLLRGLLMIFQAIDHCAVTSTAYSHGQAMGGEMASTKLTRWNHPGPYTMRLLTHLCAPGFMFLLGMGVVYFGRSRSKLGWTMLQMIRHFFVRMVVLIIVNLLIGWFALGRFLPMLNIVLWALAINYFLVGLLWLVMAWTEPRLAILIALYHPDTLRASETSSLLHPERSTPAGNRPVSDEPARISFHVHNALLLMFAVVSVWWNIWLDPRNGHCVATSTEPVDSTSSPWFDFFFRVLQNHYILSPFPPLAWLSPAILGLLYGRIVLSRPWKPMQLNLSNAVIGLVLIVLFVFTRLFHFGNLEENCMGMPEHLAHPYGNQYLASPRSFFYITKYPPSPAFILFTMGCNFLLLAIFGLVPVRAVKRLPMSVLIVFGTSALFFYALHLMLYTVLGWIAKQLVGHRMDFDNVMHPGMPAWGIGFGIVFWVDYFLGLLILWPVCKWYGNFKSGKGVDSIWRFF